MEFHRLRKLIKANMSLANSSQGATGIPVKFYGATNEYSDPTLIVDAFATLFSGIFLVESLDFDLPDIDSSLPALCV
ncbi:hypothetical protein Trydic_g12765 [Trypoxylus dichotomus]